MRRLSGLCLLVLFSAGCKSAPPSSPPARPAAELSAPTPTAPPKKRLVFLGDSLTAGYGLPASAAFPAHVRTRLEAAGLAYEVTNAGVSGDTSAGGLRRLDWIFQRPIDVLWVCLGANDGLRGLSVDALATNLSTLVRRAQGKGAKVVLAGMRLPRNYGAEYRARFDAVFPRVAKETGAAFLPFLLEGVAGDATLNLPDGIHPNAQGHERVAALVFAHLEPLLRAR